MRIVCCSNDCKYNKNSSCSREDIVIYDSGMCGNRKI